MAEESAESIHIEIREDRASLHFLVKRSVQKSDAGAGTVAAKSELRLEAASGHTAGDDALIRGRDVFAPRGLGW